MEVETHFKPPVAACKWTLKSSIRTIMCPLMEAVYNFSMAVETSNKHNQSNRSILYSSIKAETTLLCIISNDYLSLNCYEHVSIFSGTEFGSLFICTDVGINYTYQVRILWIKVQQCSTSTMKTCQDSYTIRPSMNKWLSTHLDTLTTQLFNGD